MRICKKAKNGKVGETSSKYGYAGGGEQFEADVKAHEERYNFLWGEFVAFMRLHKVVPAELREMFTRYYDEYLQ